MHHLFSDSKILDYSKIDLNAFCMRHLRMFVTCYIML